LTVKRLVLVLILVTAAFTGLAVSSLGATSVSVSGKEFKFTLSKRTVPPGSVTFRFTNRGRVKHDFKIAGKKTPVINRGRSATLRVALRRGSYRYVCTVPGHSASGMKGTLRVR
jgi:plastocyanin